MGAPIIFLSDLHGGLRLPHAKVAPDASTSDRLEDVLDVIKQVERYAKKHEVEHIFVLGDVFDKQHPDAPTLIKMARALRELAGDDERIVHLLPGNHDAHDTVGNIYSLQLFDELKVHGLDVMLGDPVELPGVTFWPIPWVPEKRWGEKLHRIQHLKKARKVKPSMDVLLLHQTMIGAYEGGFVAKHGIPSKIIAGFDWALSGHIHKHQYFDTTDGKHGMYLGSPLCFRFTDADDEPDTSRGFWVMDEDGELERVPVKAPGFVRWVFIDDDEYTVKEACEESLWELLEEMDEHLSRRPIYLQVQIEGFREDVDFVMSEVTAGVTKLKNKKKLRMCRYDRRYLDDGAGIRARKFVTKSGAVTDPKVLSQAFVSASATKIAETDHNAEELINFLDEEGVLT